MYVVTNGATIGAGSDMATHCPGFAWFHAQENCMFRSIDDAQVYGDVDLTITPRLEWILVSLPDVVISVAMRHLVS